jgi:tight adherence protein B
MEREQIFIISFLSFFILFLMIANIIVSRLYEKKKLAERIISTVGRRNNFLLETEKLSIFKKDQRSLLERKIAQYLRNRPRTENQIRLKLYRAGMEGHLSRLFGATTLTSVTIVIAISIMGYSNYIYDILLSIVLAILLTYLVLNFLEQRFKSNIIQQLPLAIEIILRGIKSGSSVEKTFAIIVKEVPSPLKNEFAKIIQQIEFGISFDDALHQAADRIDLSDFYFFTTALVIQRRGGASLSEILENIITSLNRANEIRKKIQVLSAEAKVTAYILGSLPIVIWLVMIKLNPSYLDFFRFEAIGQKMLFLAIGLMVCGIWTIRHLIKIKV